MITKIEALGYRCLGFISQPLSEFHVLVGPNASGKTTFLDVVPFLGDIVSGGLDTAIYNRTQNFEDLLWNREGQKFELAIEAKIPNERRNLLKHKQVFDTIRYEIVLQYDKQSNEISICHEKVLLKKDMNKEYIQRTLFPSVVSPPKTIMPTKRNKLTRPVINKVLGGNDNFYSEVYSEKGKGWAPAFKLGPHKSALGNLPEDESKFPVTTWFRSFLSQGVQKLILNSLLIRKASPPGKGKGFLPDGSNIPWVIDILKWNDQKNYQNWIRHLQTALPDIQDVNTVERTDDKHRYLEICYRGGLRVPSWMASDGTLRLLALTLPAYLKDFSGVYLIEEPENGIHPRAVETVYQSLSSVYNAQILLATHSPVILSMVEPNKVLCFAKTDEGITDIVIGSEHPKLKEWKKDPDLGTLFASGVLG